jgi:AraC-like DNA-binding protein
VLRALLYERHDSLARSRIEAEVSRAQILERGIASIDRCLTDSDLPTQTDAEAVGVSVRQLQRAFALAGTTPTDYLLKKRFEKACQMLSGREKDAEPMLVSSIAYVCGFNDVSYFNRQFRRFFGCAPGQFDTRTG